MMRHATDLGAAVALAGAVVLALGPACEPIVATPGSSAPINACPAYPCTAYKQAGSAPSCNGGTCTVAENPTGLLLVIGIATDSYLAPGRTYLKRLQFDATGAGAPPADSCGLTACSPPLCALEKWVDDQGNYLIDPKGALEANWYLGNKGATVTSLPVQASYRRLFGTPPQDAADLGLPVAPVQVLSAATTSTVFPGPNATGEQTFDTYLQPGCYERTLQPFSPLSEAFPPEIKPWPSTSEFTTYDDFDTTSEESLSTGLAKSVPTFDIGRAEGLEGWTAYLRDIGTRRVYSNVVPLHGSLAQGVTLLTNHVLPGSTVDALADLELVVAPPVGSPMPTEVFAPIGTPPSQELAAQQVYPTLPTPVTVTGRIQTTGSLAVPADVYFTATGIARGDGENYPPNFELSTHVSTSIDPRTGASTYSALLPRGDYQLAVRPTDTCPTPADTCHAVALSTISVGGQGNTMTGEDIDVVPLVAVTGTAVVADGRPLAEAIAEVLPVACAPFPGLPPPATAAPDTSDSCLPRPAQTTTDAFGSFTLAVDPGQYLLRIRPRDGSRLPWTIEPIVVGSLSLPLGQVTIPAPISVGMQLTDSTSPAMPENNNRLVNAVVSVFTDPSQGGPAIELGQAITDGNGNYQMYIALPIP